MRTQPITLLAVATLLVGVGACLDMAEMATPPGTLEPVAAVDEASVEDARVRLQRLGRAYPLPWMIMADGRPWFTTNPTEKRAVAQNAVQLHRARLAALRGPDGAAFAAAMGWPTLAQALQVAEENVRSMEDFWRERLKPDELPVSNLDPEEGEHLAAQEDSCKGIPQIVRPTTAKLTSIISSKGMTTFKRGLRQSIP